jgi:hypothetical protein
MKRVDLNAATAPATKELRAEADTNRSDAWRVVDALADTPEWHAIHLEYVGSGQTGKFYRIYVCDTSDSMALTHWGARPAHSTNYAYGERGQYKPAKADKARELLRAKIAKGYRVVAEGSFRAEKNVTGAQLASSFDRLARDNAVSFLGRPQWSGWRYF